MLPVAAAGDSDPGVFDLCGMAVPRGRPRGFILTGTVLARMMLCRMGLAPAGYLGSGSLRQSLPGDSHRASLGGGELVVSRTLQTPEPGSASHSVTTVGKAPEARARGFWSTWMSLPALWPQPIC